MIKQIVLIFLYFMTHLSCMSQNPDSLTIKYYESWGGYKIPRAPQKELSENEIEDRVTYYKAYYIEKNLVKFEKYFEGELDWYDEYVYWEKNNKLKQHISVNALGEKKIHLYNKRGKLITE